MRWALVVLMLLVVACGGAQQSPEVRSQAIAARVWSPYCPGRLLTECTTRQAEELRHEIRRRVVSGSSDAEVLAWARKNYGDEVLAEPAPGAAGLVIWLVPAAILLGGVLVLVLALRRWTRPGREEPDEARRLVREEWERGR